MAKPVDLRMTYVVYQPNYVPLSGKLVRDVETLKKARRIARKFGAGASIVRWYRKRGKISSSSWNDARPWVLE